MRVWSHIVARYYEVRAARAHLAWARTGTAADCSRRDVDRAERRYLRLRSLAEKFFRQAYGGAPADDFDQVEGVDR